MLAAHEKLIKILRLEQSQGYRNRAVIGGFEAFTQNWRSECEAEIRATQPLHDHPWQVAVASSIAERLTAYVSASPDQRTSIIEGILAQLTSPTRETESSTPELALSELANDSQPLPRTALPTPAIPLAKPTGAPPPPIPAPEPGQARRGLEAPVTSLPSIKTSYAARLGRLGLTSIRDLLFHFPHRYDDYRNLKPINRLEYGDETTIIGVVWETRTRQGRGGQSIVTSVIADASGTLEAVWFNQPYLARQLRAGRRIVLSGKVDERLGRPTLQSPAWEPLESELIHTGRLVPIYPLTSGVSARWMRRLMKRVVDHWAPRLEDHLPVGVREHTGLVDLGTALRQIHFPDSQEATEQARRRLAFDEFLAIQLAMVRQRHEWRAEPGIPLARHPTPVDAFLGSLPFELTGAQKGSLERLLDDVSQSHPMRRLLQGDVGSGKTVVAAAGIVAAVASGKQAALMAPTEILAEQHFQTLQELFKQSGKWGLERPISSVLLTGSLRRVERGEVYAALASGQADVVVGTHALIQRHVSFHDLALVIVDEQHRFGVAQRASLRDKGGSPHVLVMSATPIPRSLALTVYADLDISIMDEMPPGRKAIETRWLLPRERERAYAFLRSQIEKGRQAFVLYPLIEESEKLEARSAVAEYERLQASVFPDLILGLLHGRMKSREKDKVMTGFRDGEIQILVSTSVIEVGIDVPNATVMLIEGADRFGLAQLHQFRGRVGRGAHQSYCLLLSDQASPDDPRTRSTWERLKAIEETQDGFALAEKDLELRGPGDFFGVRQSGLPALKLASLSDVHVLELAREAARTILDDDPTLSRPENRLLSREVARFWHTDAEPG